MYVADKFPYINDAVDLPSTSFAPSPGPILAPSLTPTSLVAGQGMQTNYTENLYVVSRAIECVVLASFKALLKALLSLGLRVWGFKVYFTLKTSRGNL